jgi:hypothetical protein
MAGLKLTRENPSECQQRDIPISMVGSVDVAKGELVKTLGEI